jgi:hypothetical protein
MRENIKIIAKFIVKNSSDINQIKRYYPVVGLSADKIHPRSIRINKAVPIERNVFEEFNSDAMYGKANNQLKWAIKQNVWGNIEYEIIFDDGEELNGVIDVEPYDFWDDKPFPFTWHINTFYNNLANAADKPPYKQMYKASDFEGAQRLVTEYYIGQDIEANDPAFRGNEVYKGKQKFESEPKKQFKYGDIVSYGMYNSTYSKVYLHQSEDEDGFSYVLDSAQSNGKILIKDSLLRLKYTKEQIENKWDIKFSEIDELVVTGYLKDSFYHVGGAKFIKDHFWQEGTEVQKDAFSEFGQALLEKFNNDYNAKWVNNGNNLEIEGDLSLAKKDYARYSHFMTGKSDKDTSFIVLKNEQPATSNQQHTMPQATKDELDEAYKVYKGSYYGKPPKSALNKLLGAISILERDYNNPQSKDIADELIKIANSYKKELGFDLNDHPQQPATSNQQPAPEEKLIIPEPENKQDEPQIDISYKEAEEQAKSGGSEYSEGGRKFDARELVDQEINYATRKGTNRSDKVIPQAIVDEIEDKGMTIERAENLGVPVFIYKTQITLHGIFNELKGSGRVGGYKSIIVNQNKTIGVRYVAIDAEKKSKIRESLRMVRSYFLRIGQKERLDNINFQFSQDSRGTEISYMEAVTEENYKQVIEEMKALFAKIPNIFIGNKNIKFLRGGWYGNFVVIRIDFKAIYEKNLWAFIDFLTDGYIASERDFIDFENKLQELDRLEEEKRKRKQEELNRIATEVRLGIEATCPFEMVSTLPSGDFILAVVQPTSKTIDEKEPQDQEIKGFSKQFTDEDGVKKHIFPVIRVYYVFYNHGHRYWYKDEFFGWEDVARTTIDRNKSYPSMFNKIEKSIAEKIKEGKFNYYSVLPLPTVQAQVSVAAGDIGYSVEKSRHTKKNIDIWLVRMSKRVGMDDYNVIERKVKNAGGYYSKFVRCFVFESEPDQETLKNIFS